MAYALIIFVAAFLLFQVQLVMGKLLLPWYGGSPAVWTTCMLFFQVVLLAGYAYSHWLSGRRPAIQRAVHAALTTASLVALLIFALIWGHPLLPNDDWRPSAYLAPQWQILMVLAATVGLPFLLLATTSPLLQHWKGRQTRSDHVYRLYAVSNAGSLLGLISYPFVFEPAFSLATQALLWSGAFIALTATLLWLLAKAPPTDTSVVLKRSAGIESVEKLSVHRILAWLGLSASTSTLLLAVTNELCQEVASVPFLWMLPLVLYLVTFIICFDHPRWYQRRPAVFLAAALSVVVLITSYLHIRIGLTAHILAFGGFLFFICMVCHGELVRTKPTRSRLTLFYLCVAIGGACGGLFVGLIAPAIFNSYWEFNLSLTLAWVLIGLLLWGDKRSVLHTGDWLHAWLLLWFASYIGLRAVLALLLPDFDAELNLAERLLYPAAAAACLSGILAAAARGNSWMRSNLWPRASIVTVLFLAESFMLLRMFQSDQSSLHMERNFFGTLRIELDKGSSDWPPSVRLMHGRINHGMQIIHPDYVMRPVSYYGPGSGIHAAIHSHPRRLAGLPLRIGVLGLGVGTSAAFAQPGDVVRFYEIDPSVVEFSFGKQPFFSYVKDSKGSVELAVGDARRLLEDELQAGSLQQFDILMVDAFSSDSVPVHLLTGEAFQLYEQHLRDSQSVLAVNISNRFLDFRDLVANQAAAIGCVAYAVRLRDISLEAVPCHWMLLLPSDAPPPALPDAAAPDPWQPRSPIRWSDQYSPLRSLLR